MTKANFIRGGFRAWLLLSAGWLAFGLQKWSYDIGYSYQYHFRYDTLTTRQEAEERCSWRIDAAPRPPRPKEEHPHLVEFLSEEFRKAEKSRIEQEEQAYLAAKGKYETEKQRCVEEYTPHPSSEWWVLWLIGPPTLGVLFIGGLLYSVFRILQWVYRGFFPPKD